KGTAWGEKTDPKKHEMRGEVKAVTYHKMEIGKDGEYYRVQVIFDV
ncbi:MAG: archease, partial [Candidatus Aenigmarchaeota archaeon]|nr:archease [Candidatus Aenigmarchaeota archaeon]